ncbi:HTH-type transcriptional regulator RafR [Roseibaca ekhonensis]|jgi:LacI family transcriptional regulator|uniref:HTH-type transcriptional regulator RafR n=1 Tax=Roseinatronobacter ekhonensis TaxID=254356 RepID=A0A3B0MR53_9RHOB|nr:substrate-binding domain-containing protein [Roseibaca ekhonensis]SUZ32099.1 HTH-type transcriptional regulator RafR [Roseibaca ekhonensis]
MGVTLKELAASLGLSPTTVSRALNGYPEVNIKTRQRVADAARAANYHPNTRAKSLATGQSRAVGHVIPISTSHEIVNPIFADFIAGAGEAYSRAGYDMVLSVVPDAEEEAAYRNLVARGTVDGLMVHGPRLHDDRIGLLHDLGLPFMVHGRSSGVNTPYSWLDINNRRSFRRATEFLLDLGHTRIALVNGLEGMDFAMRRRTGYLDALEAAGIAPDRALMRTAEMTEPYGHQAGRELLRLPDPPTAMLASSMIVAYGLRRALTEVGLQPGRDVSVITHDDDLSYMPNGLDVPQFTATCSSVRDAGRKAAEMLLALVNDPDLGPINHLMETRLVLGDSTGRNRL